MSDDATARLFQAFVNQDPTVAISVIERAKQSGVAQVQLFDQVFAPALSLLGGAWAAGTIDEYVFTQASVIAEQITSFVIPPTTSADTGIIVLIGTMHHDLHTIEKDITAAALKEAGHRVIDLGADVRPADFLERAEETGAGVVIVYAQLIGTARSVVARPGDARRGRAKRRRDPRRRGAVRGRYRARTVRGGERRGPRCRERAQTRHESRRTCAKRASMSGRSEHVSLAEDLARQGHVAPAVDACYRALRNDDADPLIHAMLADLFLSGDFYDEAIRSATRAIELDAGCAPAYLALGLAYDRRGGMWDQSILVWNELAEVVPDLVTAHVQLGEAFSAAAFDSEAVGAWRHALELNPREARAMYNLAVAALKRDGMATALPGFRKAGELDASQDDFFFSLAGVIDDGTPAPDPATVPADRASRLSAAFALAFEEDLFAAADLIRAHTGRGPRRCRDARARRLRLPQAGGGERGDGGRAALSCGVDAHADGGLRAGRRVREAPGPEPQLGAGLRCARQGGPGPSDAARAAR